MKKNKFFILIITTALLPLMWWFFYKGFPVIALQKTSLNINHVKQANYWYVYFCSGHLERIIYTYIIYKCVAYMKFFTKWLYLYNVFLFIEYFFLGGRTPVIAFVGALVFLGIDVYKKM